MEKIGVGKDSKKRGARMPSGQTKRARRTARAAERETPATSHYSSEIEAEASRHSQAFGSIANSALLPGEDPEAYRALHNELKQQYRPETPCHFAIVSRAASLIWRLGRIPKFEVAIFNSAAESLGVLEQLRNLKLSDDTRSVSLGHVLSSVIQTDGLGRISQYEATLRDQLELVSKELADIQDWHFKFDLERGTIGFSEEEPPPDPPWLG